MGTKRTKEHIFPPHPPLVYLAKAHPWLGQGFFSHLTLSRCILGASFCKSHPRIPWSGREKSALAPYYFHGGSRHKVGKVCAWCNSPCNYNKSIFPNIGTPMTKTGIFCPESHYSVPSFLSPTLHGNVIMLIN